MAESTSFTKIVKENGKTKKYVSEKAVNAIQRAMDEVEYSGKIKAEDVVEKIEAKLKETISGEYPTTNEWALAAVEILNGMGLEEVAEGYYSFREEKQINRLKSSSILKTFGEILYDTENADSINKENANISGSEPAAQLHRIGSEANKNYVLNYILPKSIKKAHQEKWLHIHDLDYFELNPNCLQVDLKDILERGYSTGNVWNNEPKSILTAAMLAAIVIQSSTNNMHGGQSIGNLDYALAKYVNISYRKYFKDAVENYYAIAEKEAPRFLLTDRLINRLYYGITTEDIKGIYSREVDRNYKRLTTKIKKRLDGIDTDVFEIDVDGFKTSCSKEEAVKLTAKLYPAGHTTSHDNKILNSNRAVPCQTLLINGEDATDLIERRSGNLTNAELKAIERFIKIAEKETEKETNQAMQAICHNFSSLNSRAANQPPFSSVNFGLCTSKAGRLVSKSLIEILIKGAGNHETFIYPIAIFHVMEGINYFPGDPNYDLYKLAMKASANRFYPNYVFVDTPFQFQYVRNKKGQLLWLAKENHYCELGLLKKEEQDALGDSSVLHSNMLERIRSIQRLEHSLRGKNRDKLFDVQEFMEGTGSTKAVSKAKDSGYELPMELDSLCAGYDDRTIAARMGCTAGDERITIRVHGECGEVMTIENYTIADAFSMISVAAPLDEEKKEKYPDSEYYDTSDLNIEILSENKFVKMKGILCNSAVASSQMCKVVCNKAGEEKTLHVTIDHPLVTAEGRKFAGDLTSSDVLYDSVTGEECNVVKVITTGDNIDTYDVETESDKFDLSGIVSHNCRTYVESDQLVRCNQYKEPSKYKFVRGERPPYATTLGRGNFNFVTMNLPKFAIESILHTEGATLDKEDSPEATTEVLSKFYNYLLKYMVMAKNVLQYRQSIIGEKTANNFKFIVEQGLILGSQQLKENEKTNDLWEHFSKSIGFIGMYEVMWLIFHKKQADVYYQELAIVEFMRKFTDALSNGYYVLPTAEGLKDPEWYLHLFDVDQSTFSRKAPVRSEWDIKYQVYSVDNEPIFLGNKNKLKKGNFSVFATPAEGSCGTFCKSDKKRYGAIENVTDKDYYTNSNHIDVNEHVTVAEKAKLEGEFHTLCSAGDIFYIETDGFVGKNLRAYEDILNIMKENEMGYCAVNIPVDQCGVCNYVGEIKEGEGCPCCGNTDEDEIMRVRRITGYLVSAGTSKWNSAKKAEEKRRYKHVQHK